MIKQWPREQFDYYSNDATVARPADWITNVSREDEALVRQAAEETNTAIRIEDDAVDYQGKRVRTCLAVYGEDRDFVPGKESAFWKRVRELREARTIAEGQEGRK